MCCFSRPVESVSSTKIFARWTSAEEGKLYQCVAYQMNYKAKEDLAMVLPIPSAAGSGEKAVKFINFEKTADLFSRLHECFPEPPAPRASRNLPLTDAAPAKKLEVVLLDDFTLPFVP